MSEGIGQTLRHRSASVAAPPAPAFRLIDGSPLTQDAVDRFARLLYADDSNQSALEGWIARHAPLALPSLLLELLTPAAQRLGDMWVADECGFTDVTLGMHRLTLLLIALDTADRAEGRAHGGRVLVSVAPEDQHGFGPAMLATFLRRAGWDVTADLAGDADGIVAAVARKPFNAVALSIGHERAILPTAALIAKVRAASCHKGIGILVGGPMIAADPARVALLGADATANDGPGAVAALEKFIADTSQMV